MSVEGSEGFRGHGSGSASQRAGILTTNEGIRWALRFEKQHLGEILCIKNEFLQGALLIPDKQRIQNRLSKM
jgi:hypothetical protein